MTVDNEGRSRKLRIAAATSFVAYALFVIAFTTWPFEFFSDTAAISAKWAETEWYFLYYDEQGQLIIDHDLILNILFFMPLGAAWGFAGPHRPLWKIVLGALAVGLALSVFVEGLQVLTPDRSTQIADVWRNALGAVLGGLYAGWVQRATYVEGSSASAGGGGS